MAGPAKTPEPRTTPPLPARLLALAPIAYVGTALWALAAVVLGIAHYGFDKTQPIWMWTCAAGACLGIIGILIMRWQRSAADRGSRSAQKMD
ncbi:DUF2530 domain-containing protein [Actinokineospora enzanensis]|uniref:DUF2530 domain-containing protein n=1 Tax=Actinokineospora enzanensis TaxID=155975 RepID=UPI0006875EAC|nr:DUF2530 domain-containing protein [Actinokineospora enzanensis]